MMDDEFEPAYLKLVRSGEMQERVATAFQQMGKCDLCAWECQVDRQAGSLGVCRSGVKARLSSYGPHLGEEDPLRGWRGSGTIFFARCNLRCQFCQNYDISQTDAGEELEPNDLAAIMLELQNLGCHNINLVSPSHVVPQILAAIWIAAQNGLRLPVVYNTGGYDSIERAAPAGWRDRYLHAGYEIRQPANCPRLLQNPALSPVQPGGCERNAPASWRPADR